MPKTKLSLAELKKKQKGEEMRNHHTKLYDMIGSYFTCPLRLQDVDLPMGPTGSITADAICPIQYVIQDMDEGDCLCGHFHSHNEGVQKQCLVCTVNFEDLQDPEAICQFVTQEEIFIVANSHDKDLHKQWSTHWHKTLMQVLLLQIWFEAYLVPLQLNQCIVDARALWNES